MRKRNLVVSAMAPGGGSADDGGGKNSSSARGGGGATSKSKKGGGLFGAATTSSSPPTSPGGTHHRHPVHVDSNAGMFPGFPNLSMNFFNKQSPGEGLPLDGSEVHNDTWNYALLVALYTLQGIPMGLSASIPFLIQQKVKTLAEMAAATAAATAAASSSAGGGAAAAASSATATAAAAAAAEHAGPSIAKIAYSAQAIFALCSWPFSLKLLWAPIVDAVYFRRFGRRKSWLVPVQLLAGIIMIYGSNYVETQLGLSPDDGAAGMSASLDVKGVTAFFFALYFLMATQDIAVDGWALTMLSKKNRGRGPVCNSIGQNLGYFLSFVGFLAFNDAESSEKLWRPLLGLPSKPGEGIVSLGGFIRFMGFFMVGVTTFVALFKREMGADPLPLSSLAGTDDSSAVALLGSGGGNGGAHHTPINADDDEDEELDAAKIGLAETYHRLWAVCQLPAVRWLFLILLTYRLPTALSDNVKFLKAVEFGLSKQTTALLSPLIVLPLGIAVPIFAAKVWKGHPLKQFTTAYKFRVTLVAIMDVLMLMSVRTVRSNTDLASQFVFWTTLVSSTALQATMQSLQFNAQMTFFASRVDPAIGGSYMTLLNTAANLGGTWPSSAVMYLVGALTVPPSCRLDEGTGVEVCTGGKDAYFPLQLAFSVLGCLWLVFMGGRVKYVADLPEESWRTHLEDEDEGSPKKLDKKASELENGSGTASEGKNKTKKKHR